MMKLYPQQLLSLIVALVLFACAMPRPAEAASSHIVDLAELRQELTAVQQARASDLADIERVLSLPQAQEALAKAHVTSGTALAAIAELNDQELSRLADRARSAENDVQGGFIVGILALIGLIVVIIVVINLAKD